MSEQVDPSASWAVLVASSVTAAAMIGLVVVAQLGRELSPPVRALLSTVGGVGGVTLVVRGLAGIPMPCGALRAGSAAAAAASGVAMSVFGTGALALTRAWAPSLEQQFLRHESAMRALLGDGSRAAVGLALLALVAAPAVCEEALFRGLLRGMMARATPRARVLAIGALFSLFHGSVVVLLPMFFVGAVLTSLAERTGGWGTPAIAHAALNAFSVTVAAPLLGPSGALSVGASLLAVILGSAGAAACARLASPAPRA